MAVAHSRQTTRRRRLTRNSIPAGRVSSVRVFLLQVTLVLTLVVLAVNVARHRPVLEPLLFTLALAVAVHPS